MENRRNAAEEHVAQFECLLYCLHFTKCSTQPDKGKAVGKLLKHSLCTFIQKGTERKKFSMPRLRCAHIRARTLKHSYYLGAA
jgi:hypothetical protein